jgi:uncharacterized membrane protein
MEKVNSLFVIGLSVGVLFLIISIIILNFPPKKINGWYGYRSASSMKSQERWDFAQIYSSRFMVKVALGMVFLGFLGIMIQTSETLGTAISLGTMIIMLGIMVYKTEAAIHKKFDNA